MSDSTAPAIPALLLVGCGKMGGALLHGWREQKLAGHYFVVEPGSAAGEFASDSEISVASSADRLPERTQPTVIVFAVKPQVMAEVVSTYRRFVGAHTLFLSIAAGKTLGFLARHLGPAAAIVRAMPNTPAAIGRGIAVGCCNTVVTSAQRRLAEDILGAVGDVAWVEDESLIDAVTAVSGSGPAYVFLLIECLAKAGMEAGLPEELATRLARATISGSGELARLSPESAAKLRENVTSPGGTTRAALDVLMAEDGLQPLLTRAVLAATRRSRELAD